ncbi:MAG TPA: DUF3037 domain-containing protein [Gemmatimonadaceae bacterium]|nr:DUF3037 domain-containing protein [Gemmatimonadaceae bacterium]
MTRQTSTPDSRWISYDFAVLRVVPHVYVGAFVPVGVMVHARTEEFLAMRAMEDVETLRARVPRVDHDLLARYLRACRAVCEGDAAAGPVALAPPSERFHWLTAPRSDVIQSSPIHEGLCRDLGTVLDELWSRFVEPS